MKIFKELPPWFVIFESTVIIVIVVCGFGVIFDW